MFSVITNIYNKKTKRPTVMELFTATGKLKKISFFFYNKRCSMCAPRMTQHTSIRYSSCCHTHINMSFGFLVINVCNHGEHYETPCMYDLRRA